MPSTALRKQLMSGVRSVVVKVGTAVLTGEGGRLDTRVIASIARQLAALHARGIRTTLVSSGAIGSGMGLTKQANRPRSVPMLQATAAIGQPSLMALYAKTLAKFGMHAGQVLVTRTDFEHRTRYINISNTITSLQRLNALPIINENDTIAVDELDRFADNDTIAALVTNLLRADLLVILTSVEGLLDSHGQLVDLVTRVDGEIKSLATAGKSSLGSGGMLSKLEAAKLITDAGEIAVIADGRRPNVLTRLLAGARTGTIFMPGAKKMSARQRWILSAVRPAGQLHIDAGAAAALLTGGKSLLASGIRQVSGKFERGAIVRILSPEGHAIAHGVTNYNQAELEKIKGLKSSQFADVLGQKPFDEAIHRDNLVLVAGD